MANLPSPSDVASKWVQNTGAATDAYTKGVQAVTQAPGAAAARSADLWATNVAAAKSKFAANVGKVSLTDWQNAATNKGAARLASGVQAAQDKYTSAMTGVLTYMGSVLNNLPQRGTLEQNINRATTYMRGMAQYKKS